MTTHGSVSKTSCPDEKAMGAAPLKIIAFVEAVLYRYRAGIPWRDLPERSGDFRVIYTRFTRWSKSVVWEGVFIEG